MNNINISEISPFITHIPLNKQQNIPKFDQTINKNIIENTKSKQIKYSNENNNELQLKDYIKDKS